ncbi:hypothetical protein [Microbacterium sp. UFMG61]|uniref:hypothetical protein n=1 Tax=Microbacterium sp. UFMG61 TaxID=2745935 RepID=UPI00188F5388|nr:hypothetical protein [Microbacterium sp. UFMG61]
MGSHRDGRRTIPGVGAGFTAVALALTLSGCGVVLKEVSDGEFAETVPAALAESDRGVTDSYAAKGLDGFTFYLSVGIDVDRETVDADDLAGFLRAILESNDLPTDEVRLRVQNAEGDFLDLEAIALEAAPDVELFGSSDTTLLVDNEQAIEIVKAVWGD